ncbi:unnamed protein product [Boreogadus saida]
MSRPRGSSGLVCVDVWSSVWAAVDWFVWTCGAVWAVVDWFVWTCGALSGQQWTGLCGRVELCLGSGGLVCVDVWSSVWAAVDWFVWKCGALSGQRWTGLCGRVELCLGSGGLVCVDVWSSVWAAVDWFVWTCGALSRQRWTGLCGRVELCLGSGGLEAQSKSYAGKLLKFSSVYRWTRERTPNNIKWTEKSNLLVLNGDRLTHVAPLCTARLILLCIDEPLGSQRSPSVLSEQRSVKRSTFQGPEGIEPTFQCPEGPELFTDYWTVRLDQSCRPVCPVDQSCRPVCPVDQSCRPVCPVDQSCRPHC